MFANIKAAIIDLDGTMVNTAPDFHAAINRMRADLMLPPPAARAAGCYVLNVPYGYNHGEPIQGVDSDGIVPTLLEAAHLIG